MYYWQYKLHMKGGKNNAKLDLNPSLSAKHNEKSRQACLNAIFLLCFALSRGECLGMSYLSEQIPPTHEDSKTMSAVIMN